MSATSTRPRSAQRIAAAKFCTARWRFPAGSGSSNAPTRRVRRSRCSARTADRRGRSNGRGGVVPPRPLLTNAAIDDLSIGRLLPGVDHLAGGALDDDRMIVDDAVAVMVGLRDLHRVG